MPKLATFVQSCKLGHSVLLDVHVKTHFLHLRHSFISKMSKIKVQASKLETRGINPPWCLYEHSITMQNLVSTLYQGSAPPDLKHAL